MRNRILLASIFVCCFCFSCGKGQGGENPSEPVFEVGYTMGTRADGSGKPENKDTFTIISYRVSDLNNVATTEPFRVVNNNQRGFYIYLDQNDAAYVEEDFLVPVEITNLYSTTTPNLNPADSILVGMYPYRAKNAANPARNNDYGQKLQAGKYKTAVIHPAAVVIDSQNATIGSCLVVLPRDIECPVYAPMPDGLFDMTVEHNMTVYQIEDNHKLYTTMAMMRAYFYSSPNANYEIESVRLLNMGKSGWFNPYTGITYLNYGTEERAFTLSDAQVIANPAHWRVSDLKGGSETALGTVTDNGGTYPVHYLMGDEAVFATDYRGLAEGGTLSQYVKSIIMRITVNMIVPNTTNKQVVTADIPISLNIQRGKLYNFYFDVRSGIFSVTYSVQSGAVSGWNDGGGGDEETIGETLPYGSFDFEGGGGWTIENGGDGDIEIGAE